MLRNVNFACKIYPAAQNDIGKQQWVTGFIVCVKCCRMVDSVARWQLSLSWPIHSDYLSIADRMILPLGREHSHGKTQYIPGKQVLVRSWQWKIYRFWSQCHSPTVSCRNSFVENWTFDHKQGQFELQNGVLDEWDNFEQNTGAEWYGKSGVKLLCMKQLL